MADDSHVTKVLDEMKSRVTATLEAARTQLAALNGTEAMFGMPLTQFQDLMGGVSGIPPIAAVSQSGQSAPVRRGLQSLRKDEFLGDEPMEAAKKFMRAAGQALEFSEIADAVQRGGAAIQGADWRDRLELSLKRSPYQVITVSEHTYGLAEFYTEEQLTRLRTTRRAGETRPVAKKKPGPKPKGKTKPKPVKTAKKTEPVAQADDAGPKHKKQPSPKTDETTESEARAAGSAVH